MDSENARDNINLLAKLLKADKSKDNGLFGKERDAFYQVLSHEFSEALDNSSIKQSERIFADIEKIADGLELFSHIPELLGKTLVGVFGGNTSFSQRVLTVLVGNEGAETALQDTNLPCVFLDTTKMTYAFNDMSHRVRLGKNEYCRTNKVLWQHNIDIRNFLRMFSVKAQSQFKHIGIIYFPKYVSMAYPFNQTIMSKLDACVVLTPKDDSLLQNRRWNSITYFIHKYSIPCHIIAETINDELAKESEKIGVETYEESGVYSLFEQMNVPRYNGRLLDAVELQLVKIRKFYFMQLSEIAENQKMLVSNLTYITQEDTKAAVQELSNQTLVQKNKLEDEQKTLNAVTDKLCDNARAYEDALNSKAGLSSQGEVIKECKTTIDTWSNMFLALLEIRDYSMAKKYLQKFKKSGYYFEYIYEMLLLSAQGKTIPSYALKRLREEKDTEFVRRAKIMLNRELGLAEIDCMYIARDIKQLRTADEYYYRGLWAESNNNNLKKAIRFYQEALDLGSDKAGKKLMELAGKTSKVSLQMLADAMIPEANYALALEARENGKYAKSKCYLKLAAAKEHIPSIKLLTEEIYYHVKKQYYKQKASEEKDQEAFTAKDQEAVKNAIMLYKFVIEREANQVECTERIGDLYHFLGDDHRAMNYWKKCKTPTAFYSLGRLYQYPEGMFGQDLDKALRYFRKALDLGHSKAETEYKKVLKWNDENKAYRKRQEEELEVQNLATKRDVSPTTVESSGCFITSAVCTALQKPDDCEELMTLRAYRDSIKSSDAAVSMLIDEYYRIAPQIVANIDKDAKASDIYRSLWENEICETYRLVKEGKYEEATKCYVKMTIKLCDKYDVELLPEIRKIICSSYPIVV